MDLQSLIKKINFKKVEPLGIDIGSTSTKIVRLTRKNPGTGLQAYSLEFAGQLMVKSSDPQFTAQLKDYLQKNKLSGLPAATCYDDSKLKVRKIEIAKMPEADLLEAIRWKMRDLVEGNIDDFIVRYSLLNETGPADAKRMVLVGFLAPRESVKAAADGLSKAGLAPMTVEPSAISLAACVDAVAPTGGQWVGAIDLGATKSIMVIIGDGKFLFSRPLTGIATPNLENMDSTFNQRLAAEIQHTLDNFSITFQVEKLNNLYLTGGGSQITGLAEYLTRNLLIESSLLNPFQGLDASSKQAPENPMLYSQAIALAMTA